MMIQTTIAAGLLFALPTVAYSTIASGEGFGTYYYDIEQVQACSSDFGPQNTGPVECSSATALSLDKLNSNYVVAMNHSQLVGDISTYCGKRVIVSVNGKESDLPLFIGDGCQRCGTGSSTNDVWDPNGAPGLDFSYSVLNELSDNACADGHISISWEIVDDTLYNFDTNAPNSPEGPVGGSGNSSPASADPSPASPSAAPASASATEAPVQSPSPTDDSPAPTTLVTIVETAVTTVTGDTRLAVPSPTSNDSSEPCPTGVWQCNANTLEQCLEGTWTTRATCADGLTCQGGNSPYCALLVSH